MEDKTIGQPGDRLRKACSCALFLAIACILLARVTYLFRNVGFDRSHMVGIREEEPLDMVYIGGSAAFFFWQPLKAWKDHGFTSYNYATATLQAEMIEPYVREVLEFQDPELFVIGLRSFQYWDKDFFHVAGFRNGSDSMDILSGNRLRMIRKCFGSRADMESEPAVSYYLDIAKYHSNYGEVLGSPEHWLYGGNHVPCAGKGWEKTIDYAWLEQPEDFLTEERAILPEGCEAILVELLESCRERNLQVLFVVCPYQITREDQMKYNAMKDLVEEYGFQYLNANEHYQEMGMDFARDFYDPSHVNCFGAEKYTAFLGEYIADTYGLPDHRGEERYAGWEEAYAGFARELETVKAGTEALIAEVEKGIEEAEAMRETTDILEWIMYADGDVFGLAAVSRGQVPQLDFAQETLLRRYGVGAVMTADEARNMIGVYYQNQGDNYFNVSGEAQSYDCTMGELAVHLESGEEAVIQIGGKAYSALEDGIYLAAVDLRLGRVADCVVLREDGEGKAQMEHFQLL